jgi:spore germination protein GerM
MPGPKRLTSVAVVLAALAAAACGSGDAAREPGAGVTTASPATTAPATTAPAPESPGTAEKRTVSVYFSDDRGRLVRERRPRDPGATALQAAMEELALGPRDPSLLPALPPGTRVLGVSLGGKIATVDLSEEFESAYPAGGAAAELAIVGAVARTAVSVPGVDAVRVTVEGRVPAPAGSQVDFAEPFTARDFPLPVTPGSAAGAPRGG